MEPASVLADLLDVSGQVETAILLDHDGAILACTLADDERAGVLGRAVRDLIAEAQAEPGSGREPLAQLRVTLEDSCVFAVQDAQRIAAAVTVPYPTAGLVFYDLKNCLRQLAGEVGAPVPRAWDGASEDDG